MAAPKQANTEAATLAVIRAAQERKASALRKEGWVVITPELADALRNALLRPRVLPRVLRDALAGEVESDVS